MNKTKQSEVKELTMVGQRTTYVFWMTSVCFDFDR